MATVEEITRHYDFDPDKKVWVDERPAREPINIVDSDPSWPIQFDELAQRIRRVWAIAYSRSKHVGSTSVADLPAKPIIDVDLTVADSSDESSYLLALQRVGPCSGYESRAGTSTAASWQRHLARTSTSGAPTAPR